MFTEFLSLIAGATVFIGAFIEGRKGGALGILIGLLIGLGVGFGVFWTTRKTIKWTLTWHQLYDAKLSPARMALTWGLIIATFVWMVLASITVTWLTRLIVRYL